MADNFTSCSVSGCNGNSHWTAKGGKGYCNTHRQRFRRYGNPLGGSTYKGDPLRFIHEIAIPYQGTDCLIWPFSRRGRGYGMVWVDETHTQSHRYICEQAHGAPPTPTHEAAHTCGQGHLGCVNPNHLEWKTAKENHADKLVHGTAQRGERAWSAKITEAQAREILRLKGTKPRREIAVEFGVNISTVNHIHNRESWAWL